MKILMGLSGGVDSSVAALILKQQGHEVIGATMSVWGKNAIVPKDYQGAKNACYGPDKKKDIEDARAVAAQIGIPFYVFDCSEQYEKIVLENFKSEYLIGRTPNPCIWCNSLIKFGILPQIAREHGVEFDKFATGHYVRVEEVNGNYILKRGLDDKKDQSYFLYRLKQEQLANILFPLGGCTKEQIRKIAKENGLLAADRPDSQDFYSGDYNELLEVEDKIGNIVDSTGKILGTHKGIWNFTIGQRKGLPGGATEPLYVLELRVCTNEVVVGFADSAFKRALIATSPNWIVKPELPAKLSAKIRSTQAPFGVSLREEHDELIVEFDNLQKSVTPGQSVVFYDDDLVLGGAIIEKTI